MVIGTTVAAVTAALVDAAMPALLLLLQKNGANGYSGDWAEEKGQTNFSCPKWRKRHDKRVRAVVLGKLYSTGGYPTDTASSK